MIKINILILLFFMCMGLVAQPHKMSSIQRIIEQSFIDITEGEQSGLMMHHIQYFKISGDKWKTIYCELTGGIEYIVFVQGENYQVNDVDLKIQSMNSIGGLEVLEDTRSNAYATIIFTPKETKHYIFNIKVSEYINPYKKSHIFILVAYKKYIDGI